MKKIFSVFLVCFLMVLSTFILSACNNNNNNDLITITFDSNGGTIIESIEIEKGSKIQEPNNCIKNGYLLDGWFLEDEEWSFLGYVATEDMCLKAEWSLISYTITYELDGGNLTNYPQTYTIEDSTILIPEPNKFKNIFEGWYLDPNFNDKIDNLDCNLCKDVILYAKWTDTYKISSEETFINFLNTPHLWSFNIELLKNINLNNTTINPIGTLSQRFSGVFNGNGYKISNFSVNISSDYVGLFGYAEDCIIKNIGLENCSIQGNINGKISCGALVGVIGGNSLVENCYIKNENISIINSNNNYNFTLGGMIGKLLASEDTINIINCYTSGNLYTTNGTVGGLVGDISTSGINSYIAIKNSYSACNINSNFSMGGLVGSNIGINIKIENCFTVGNLNSSGSELYSSRIGAVIRYSSLDEITILNCYSNIDSEFVERDTKLNVSDLYDYDNVVFKTMNEIVGDLQQYWMDFWDFSSTLPTLKIFNK